MTVTFDYYVAIDRYGQAGLAATKRTAVESEVALRGGRMIHVTAPNAFVARRQASAQWQEAPPPQ